MIMKNISIKKVSFFVLLMSIMGLQAFSEERIYNASGPRKDFDFELATLSQSPIWVTIWQEVGNNEWNCIAEKVPFQNPGNYSVYRIKGLGRTQSIKIQVYLTAKTNVSLDYIISPRGRTVFIEWGSVKQNAASLSSSGNKGSTPTGLPLNNNITNNDIHKIKTLY